jgi:hypothetical protein
LLALKDHELRVSIDAEVFGPDPALPLIGPDSVLGIEINAYAAELARVSVWIAQIQVKKERSPTAKLRGAR